MFYCSGACSLTLAQGGGSGDVAHIKCIHVVYVIIEGVDKYSSGCECMCSITITAKEWLQLQVGPAAHVNSNTARSMIAKLKEYW